MLNRTGTSAPLSYLPSPVTSPFRVPCPYFPHSVLPSTPVRRLCVPFVPSSAASSMVQSSTHFWQYWLVKTHLPTTYLVLSQTGRGRDRSTPSPAWIRQWPDIRRRVASLGIALALETGHDGRASLSVLLPRTRVAPTGRPAVSGASSQRRRRQRYFYASIVNSTARWLRWRHGMAWL